MKALIHNEIVIELAENTFQVAEPLAWVDAVEGVQTGWGYKNGVFTDPAPVVTIEDIKKKKLADLAAFRYTKEAGGIIVSGVKVDTTRDSQSILAAARTIAKEKKAANEFYSVEWKGQNGWFTLNSDQIIGIADAVAAHVQYCFSREKYFAATIQGLTSSEEIQNFNFVLPW